MQPDAPVIHEQKSDGQHRRNGDAHHQAGARIQHPAPPQGMGAAGALVQAQREKAHAQHHGHGLHQHPHEFIDRAGHHGRLVLHLLERHAGGQRAFDAGRRLFQRLAQGDDVAALGHRHAQRNHFVAIVAHLHLRRLHIAAPHLGDVLQAQLPPRRAANGHVAQRLHRAESAAHAHGRHFQRRFHAAG